MKQIIPICFEQINTQQWSYSLTPEVNRLVHRSESRKTRKMTNNNEDLMDFTIYNINP